SRDWSSDVCSSDLRRMASCWFVCWGCTHRTSANCWLNCGRACARPCLGRRPCPCACGTPEKPIQRRETVDLTPREKDKLFIFVAALLAERRKRRGIKLNH